ncbi:MAG: DUF3427 domain-containing protein [Spirochaetales bacterium]|nr:DUF3427 domain-containing protein [Spirochaetales bacterium]
MRQSYADQLSARLVIGKEYDLQDIAALLGMQLQAVKGKGVIPKANTDAVLLLVTLEKEKSAVQYFDKLEESTLCWSGQNRLRTVENYIEQRSHQFFVFIKQRKGFPYLYYGRVVPVRIQRSQEYGVPSHIVFDLYEYERKLHRPDYEETITSPMVEFASQPSIPETTEKVAVQKIRTAQTQYRNAALRLWDNRCAVTSVDDTGWLVASHIKPWRESSALERVDPKNSLILTPNYDRLFDRGIISFDPDNGRIRLPDVLPRELWMNLSRLHIDDTIHLRDVPEGTDRYLAYHNKYVFNFTPQDGITTSEYVENLLVKALS